MRERWKYQGIERKGSDGFQYHIWRCETPSLSGFNVYAWPVHLYRAATLGGRA